ncbi:hypothetical protein LOZ12_006682 [Ophidiomyces ophidiicola]|uniref:Uncharacterized protein n=1 Tax=Ophidiomyces ophidiicola TaxID=1387563 RepID=A0ACB8V4D8_9EURO|nr:hypothetical protein LOZ64_006707 [Ophidiomyces ophidiicola]KAI1932287.1 hypothetical protein LOZ62_006693 [Ophidiomyces ophidiicola]KAI1946928.1 hypothetical protein LOZ59_006748 [Ophidiomyces ophidiicola]KAI1962173.1 hypothetical protein LOZ56_006654 [Ophidiomyces ophidiicola]KAI2007526.1 hypothetical protein LOZ46_006756 [Ophidiomyces ophidiicola]
MPFFHKNKSQPSIPEVFETGGVNNNLPRTTDTRLPVHHPLATPGNQTQQLPYPFSNEQVVPALQTQQHYEESYTHPAHTVSRFSRDPPDSPPASSHQRVARPALNLVSTSSLGLGSSSDLSSAEPSYTPLSSEASPSVESHSRKLRKTLFGLTSKDKNKDKDSSLRSSRLGRTLSVRRKSPGRVPPVQQVPSERLFDPELEPKEEQLEDNNRMPLRLKRTPHAVSPSPSLVERSSNIEPQPFEPPRIQRVNTEPFTRDCYPQELNSGPPHPQLQIDKGHLHQPTNQVGGPHTFLDHTTAARSQSPQSDAHNTTRPPSQQSIGPPSPLNPQYQCPESNPQKFHFRQSLQPPVGQGSAQIGMDRQAGLRQSTDSMLTGQNSQPPTLTPGSSFKGNLSQASSNDLERTNPPLPPVKDREDFSDIDVRALIQKHEELQAKYIKVKRYYFEREAQVQQLQNTVAHQRMSTSRTVFDDNEYSTRFSRLDGAINNLAFNIRKDWKSIPQWLQPVVNEDAYIVGTKEMTAVGRACLTRWLVDELFDRYFHPSLEPTLSRQLKMIERNVRQMAKATTEEEKENHVAKLSTWRRTTLDGLEQVLTGKLAEDHRSTLTRSLVEKLTASLGMNLKDPAPPGLENGVSMIVELAVGIAANIPLESRDVLVEYFLPGAPVAESHMKLETTLPPLTNIPPESRLSSEPSSAAADRGDQTSLKEFVLDNFTVDGENVKDATSSNSSYAKEGRKKSVFGSLISKKPHPTASQIIPEPSRQSSSLMRDGKERNEVDKDDTMRIRFAAFVAVEIRSKGVGTVLVKAPVYGLV